MWPTSQGSSSSTFQGVSAPRRQRSGERPQHEAQSLTAFQGRHGPTWRTIHQSRSERSSARLWSRPARTREGPGEASRENSTETFSSSASSRSGSTACQPVKAAGCVSDHCQTEACPPTPRPETALRNNSLSPSGYSEPASSLPSTLSAPLQSSTSSSSRHGEEAESVAGADS